MDLSLLSVRWLFPVISLIRSIAFDEERKAFSSKMIEEIESMELFRFLIGLEVNNVKVER